MKKMLFFTMLLILSIPLIGQEIEPPGDVIDVITNFETYMGSMLGLGFLSIWLTGIVNGWLQTVNSWIRRMVSWVIPILIAFVGGYLFKIGLLAEKEWHIAILYGLGAGLFSNGLFTMDFIQTAVNWIERMLGNKKEIT